MTTYEENSRGRCPHCLTTVKFEAGYWYQNYGSSAGRESKVIISSERTDDSSEQLVRFIAASCPECRGLILTVETGKLMEDVEGSSYSKQKKFMADEEFVVWPHQSIRPVPQEVPIQIAKDYQEAVATLNISPKASAALSRRCLQAVLREAGNAQHHDLIKQIDAVIPHLPTYIAESIDAIRNIGNFAAHPIKDQSSGQIVDVEPGEAEWNLSVLEMLFDFYYVQPTLAKKKRDTLNTKLQSVGKPPMR